MVIAVGCSATGQRTAVEEDHAPLRLENCSSHKKLCASTRRAIVGYASGRRDSIGLAFRRV